jgi:hypothetical protein
VQSHSKRLPWGHSCSVFVTEFRLLFFSGGMLLSSRYGEASVSLEGNRCVKGDKGRWPSPLLPVGSETLRRFSNVLPTNVQREKNHDLASLTWIAANRKAQICPVSLVDKREDRHGLTSSSSYTQPVTRCCAFGHGEHCRHRGTSDRRNLD